MKALNASLKSEAAHFWSEFGIPTTISGGDLVGILPSNVVAFFASGHDQIESQRKALAEIGIPPRMSFSAPGGSIVFLYSLPSVTSIDHVKRELGQFTEVLSEGDKLRLPSLVNKLKKAGPAHIQALSDFYLPEGEGNSDDLPQQVVGGTSLDQYSLLDVDLGDVVHSSPLLGRAILKGQATVMYAAPGTGKTLLSLHLVTDASKREVIDALRTYVVNADDSGEGVQVKNDILAEYDIHMLVPGLQGFDTHKLTTSMQQMIDRDQCRDVLIIVDTLKKFADLMDKKNAAGFGDLVRRFVLKGGTFLALAHTRKNEGNEGQLVYSGTTDIVEDFDAACLLVPLEERGANGEKLVQFQFFKRRGPNADETYAYNDDQELDYLDKFASVRLVESTELHEQNDHLQYRTDEPLIEAIRSAMVSGTKQKMALVRQVCETTEASRQNVITVLQRHTTTDRKIGLWFFTVGAKGAKLYEAYPEREEVEE